ncbi:hypothetical protein BRADO3657 [Bradyrhizobium sp. ORS 278]|uniref:hypothetical protein n=1 Tax=Bradyrhizobium sp. (strain ORS 278) TaxID=114615 RepID=UPI000150800D|nr:hypothetical protein [Bradyrhizobium sp. ORS 278]CAL77434.1 hypothetical protein BRADO3657 [Bradyrhizobium sp. ORS 278]
MSYSFNIRATSKVSAKSAVAAAFDNVVVSQPIHARDKAAALANASAVIDLLADDAPEGHLIAVSCNGYVGWREVLLADGSNPLNAASVSAQASYMPSEG